MEFEGAELHCSARVVRHRRRGRGGVRRHRGRANRAVRGQIEATINVVGRRTTLRAYPVENVSGRDHIDALSTSTADVGKTIRGSIDRAVELDDSDIAYLFTEVSRELNEKL